jgi:hypothetical protein
MDTTYTQSKLSTASRVRRVAAASVLIGIVMNTSGPLGYLTLLPLLAIYPLLTGMIGEDPIDGLLTRWQGGFEGRCFRSSTRVALLVLGGAAIGAMMLSPENVGIRGVLALAAMYPIMAGLFGEDLISRMFGFGSKRATAVTSREPTPWTDNAIVHGLHAVAERHHWFSHGEGQKAA